MTQNELAFWRDAVIAALHAPETTRVVVTNEGTMPVSFTAVQRADEALEAYRKNKAEADAYHKSAVVVRNPTHFCSVCSITFDTDEAFRTHIDTVHPPIVEVNENA